MKKRRYTLSSLVTQIAQIEENLGELYGSLSKDFEGESAKAVSYTHLTLPTKA